MNIVAGRRGVLELLNGERPVKKIILAKGLKPHPVVGEIGALAQAKGVEVTRVERRTIDDLTGGGVHQGVVALVEPYRFAELPDVLAGLKGVEEALLLALDGITDPHNVGALIRTAEATGVTAVILPKRRSAPISTTVYKASAGAVEHIRITRVGNLVSALEEVKRAGFWVYGADAKAELTLFQADLGRKALLVLGSEGEGLSRLVREKCDLLVRIPMMGKVSSLNVSVAGALLMYEVFRKKAET
ncbi:MAG: 23S rRNA (guanosine(2251)-2'-O)-methyltransferase RlmB [Actinobacteria bacterium]|nr:23S rRNA (guanosine(2251)-2'-O)-methyltransferase RlmB [Actinomycetota bacterium]